MANGGAWTFDTATLACSCFATKDSYTAEQKDFWISSGTMRGAAYHRFFTISHLTSTVAAPVFESYEDTAINGTVKCGTSNVLSVTACFNFCNSRCSDYVAWSYSQPMGCYCFSNVTTVTTKSGVVSSGTC